MSRPRFNRILLKLSGEVMMGQGRFGIDPDTVHRIAAAPAVVRAVPVPTYPPAKEDFAFVVEESVPASAVEAAIVVGAGDLAERVHLFDVFTGEQIGEGKKSLAFAIRLRSGEGTLTAEQIGETRRRIIAAVQSAVGGVLRAGPLSLDLGRGRWTGTLAYDLREGRLDARGLFSGGAAPKGWTGAPPAIQLGLTGPLAAPACLMRSRCIASAVPWRVSTITRFRISASPARKRWPRPAPSADAVSRSGPQTTSLPISES